MGTVLTEILRRFLEEESVEGHLFDEGRELDVKLIYRRRGDEFEFEIQQVGPDSPPNIRFRNQLVEILNPQKKWEPLEGAEDLRIYGLLDPRLFLPIADRGIEAGGNTFRLVYKLGDLPFEPFAQARLVPSTLTELRAQLRDWYPKLPDQAYAIMLEDAQPLLRLLSETREALFYYQEERLVEMQQQDLPPFTDWLKVKFIYFY